MQHNFKSSSYLWLRWGFHELCRDLIMPIEYKVNSEPTAPQSEFLFFVFWNSKRASIPKGWLHYVSYLVGSTKVFSIVLNPCCCWGSCWDISAQQKDELMGGKLNWSSAPHLVVNPAPSVSCSGWLMSPAVQSPTLILFWAFLYSSGTWYFWLWESRLEPSTLQLSAQSTWDWQPQRVHTVLLLGIFWEKECCVYSSSFYHLIFFMTHLCEVWDDVYTFKTQPGMKLMSGGISITAQIIGLSVYRLCQVRTAQHQNGRMISIPDPERALSEGWGSLVDECASLWTSIFNSYILILGLLQRWLSN